SLPSSRSLARSLGQAPAQGHSPRSWECHPPRFLFRFRDEYRSAAFPTVMAALLLLLALGSACASSDVLTSHNDNERTGVNLLETVLKPSILRAGAFGRLWALDVDAQIAAQPLYISSLDVDTMNNPTRTRTRGTFNAVLIATMRNTV